MRALNCFYDMAVSPCSYDFFTFLYSAEICRVRRGLDTIKLVIVHGTDNYFRNDNVRTSEQNKTFFENVVIPGISLLPICNSFMWMNRDDLNLADTDPTFIFPRGYAPLKPVAEYIPGELIAAMIRGDSPCFLSAPDYANKLASDYISEVSNKKPIITLTMRELERENQNKKRNIKFEEWEAALNELNEDYTPIIIRDTINSHKSQIFSGVRECPQASIHLPFRMALYSQCHLNFTKNTGPALLMLYGKTNTIFFAEYDDDEVAISEKWFKENFGMSSQSQYPMTTISKTFFWGKETRKNILNLSRNHAPSKKNSNELNGFIDNENVKASLVSGTRHLIKVLQYNLMIEDVRLFRGLKNLNAQVGIFSDLNDELLKLDGKVLPKGTVSTLIREEAKHD